MSRIRNILKEVRYSTADPNKERYSDERILSAIDSGQKDIARQTRLLKGRFMLGLEPGKALYNLPTDVWLLTRISLGNKSIKFVSTDTMDRLEPEWGSRQGNTLEAMVYDRRNIQQLRLYPLLDETFKSSTFSSVADADASDDFNEEQRLKLEQLSADLATAISQNKPEQVAQITTAMQSVLAGKQNHFGVVTSITPGVVVGTLGVVTSVTSDGIASPMNSKFGELTNIEALAESLFIDYIKDPESLTSLDEELLVPPLFDIALKHFAIASVYSDDLDSQYQLKAQSASTLYQRELATVGYPTESSDATMNTQYNSIQYVGPFQ